MYLLINIVHNINKYNLPYLFKKFRAGKAIYRRVWGEGKGECCHYIIISKPKGEPYNKFNVIHVEKPFEKFQPILDFFLLKILVKYG